MNFSIFKNILNNLYLAHHLALAIGAIVGVSCSSHNANDESSQGTGNPSKFDSSEYVRMDRGSTLGSVEEYVLKESELKKIRNSLDEVKLREIDLTQEYSTKAYEVVTGPSTSVFILKPRVLLRSSILGEKTFIEEEPGHGLIIHVSMAFVDGLIDKIPTGVGSESIPKKFLVSNKDQLIADLSRKKEGLIEFLPKIPCPERIRIFLDGETPISLKFNTHLKSCSLNAFIPAQLSLSRDEWKRMKRGFLKANSLEVEAEVDLATPVTTEYANFTIKKLEVYSVLSSLLVAKGDFKRIRDIQTAVTELVKNLQKELQTDFEDEQFIFFKELVVQDFFKKSQCPEEGGVCFKLTGLGERASQNSSYSFNIRKEKYFGRPLFFRVRSILTDDLAARKPLLIKAGKESPLAPVAHDVEGEVSHSLTTVGESDILEIEIESLFAGSIKLENPTVKVEDYDHCTDPYSSCYDGKWLCVAPPGTKLVFQPSPIRKFIEENLAVFPYPSAMYWVQAVMGTYYAQHPGLQLDPNFHITHYPNVLPKPRFPYRIGGVFPPHHGLIPSYEWQCTDQRNNQCDPKNLEKRWRRTTTWSIPIAQPQFSPILITQKELDAVLDGLSLKFRWTEDDELKEVVCPLREMSVTQMPDFRLIVELKNIHSCSPFNEANRKFDRHPILDFVNNSSIESDFQCGTLVEDSTGIRNYRCVRPNGDVEVRDSTVAQDTSAIARGERVGLFQKYYPRLQIQTRVRNVGSYFENQDDEGKDAL